MNFDLRYNLQHIGDIFVGAVQKTADSAMQCSKGVFLTYDVKKIQRKKQQISREIGERVTVLMREGASDVSQDAVLSTLIATLNCLENELAKHENDRCNMVNPFKVKKTACECSTNGERKE
jgi:chromosome condensin MukBEF ATPase and DNA-binding subunit MukB